MASAFLHMWESTLFTLAQDAAHPAVPRTPVPIANETLLRRAYGRCDQVISEHGKTFNLASSLLPPAKRRAIRALYAFCRVTDNIVDCPSGTTEDKASRLSAWRQRVVSASPPRDDLVAIAWADTRLRYKVPYKLADQLIAGVARDLYQTQYRTFDELATYAYSVASTVGLMCMHIIGLEPHFREEEATPYIIKLGLALQLTNILRDVGENWRNGHLYLPSEELEAFGLSELDLARAKVDERWRDFMRFQIKRNRALYRESWPCIAMFSRDGRFAVAAACALYSAILDAIEANNHDVFSRRAQVSLQSKLRRLPGIWWQQRGRTMDGGRQQAVSSQSETAFRLPPN